MQEPDLPELVDNELSGFYVAAERLDLKWNYWTDYGQIHVSTSCQSANNEQQTRQEPHQARRTGRQSIICRRETQIEKRESLREGDKSVEGEEWQERERVLLYKGSTHFKSCVSPVSGIKTPDCSGTSWAARAMPRRCYMYLPWSDMCMPPGPHVLLWLWCISVSDELLSSARTKCWELAEL